MHRNLVLVSITLLASSASILLFACNNTDPSAKAPAKVPSVSSSGNAAIDHISSQIAAAPNDATLYAARADAYHQADGYDEAIADLQKAIHLDSTKANYYHLLADVYLDYFKSRRALQTMEQAADRFPEHISTRLKLSEFYLLLTKHDLALKTLDQLLKKDPQNPDAFFMLGRTFEDMGDTSRAINSYQTAVENEPDMLEVWLKLGNLFAAKGNKLALRYYDNAIRVDSTNVGALFAKAGYLHSRGLLAEAIEYYKKINRIEPQFANAYYNTGLAYLEIDSVGQAHRFFDLTVKMKPTHFKGYFYRGVSAEMQGKTTAALNDFQQAVNLNPHYEDAEKALDNLKRKLDVQKNGG